jgi:hypothetical protein
MNERKEKLLNRKSINSTLSIVDGFTLKEIVRDLKAINDSDTPEILKCYISPITTHKSSIISSGDISLRKSSIFGKRILIHKDEPNYFTNSSIKSYSIIQCPKITTYYVDNYIFSNFTNPSAIQKFYDFKSFFIHQKDRLFNVADFIGNEITGKFDFNVLNTFLVGLNNLLNSSRVVEIVTKYKRKSLINILLIHLVLLVMVLTFILVFIYDFEILQALKINYLILFLVMFLLLLLFVSLLVRLFFQVFSIPQSRDYIILQYRLESLSTLKDYIDSWNRTVFLPKFTLISVPVNLKYIHVLLEPIEILLEHHEYNNLNNTKLSK